MNKKKQSKSFRLCLLTIYVVIIAFFTDSTIRTFFVFIHVNSGVLGHVNSGVLGLLILRDRFDKIRL